MRVYISGTGDLITSMGSLLRPLLLLAATLLLVAIIPASAGHGGGSPGPGGPGGGQAGGQGSGGGGAATAGMVGQAGSPFMEREGQDAAQSGAGPGPGLAAGPGRPDTGSATAGPGRLATEVNGRMPISPGWGRPHDGEAAGPYGEPRGPPPRTYPPGPGTQAGRNPCAPAQPAEPLAGGPGSGDPYPSAPGSPRARREGEDADPDAQAPGGAISPSPFLFLPFLGFRRISGKNVLEHDGRDRIFRAIVEHPGIDAPALSRLLNANENTLRYHLFTLLRAEKITAFSRPGVVRYYPNQGMYLPFVQCLLHALWTDSPRGIILLLWHSPGMTRGQLAEAIGISGPSATRHLQQLGEDGIVGCRVSGRQHHYFLTAEALLAIESVGRTAGSVLHAVRQVAAVPSAA